MRNHCKVLCLAAILAATPMVPAQSEVVIESADVRLTRTMIETELDLLPADRRRQVLSDPLQLDRMLGDLYSAVAMLQSAEDQGLTEDPAVRARLDKARRDVLITVLVERHLAALEIPEFDALAREYYRSHADEFNIPEAIRVAHILFRVNCDCERESQREQALSVLSELNSGADFAELAARYSDDSGARSDGELPGWITRGRLVAPFENVAFALEPGETSAELVETEFGFHIIRLIDRRPAGLQTYEQVEAQLQNRFRQEYIRSQRDAFLDRFAPPADLSVDEAALDRLIQSRRAPAAVE